MKAQWKGIYENEQLKGVQKLQKNNPEKIIKELLSPYEVMEGVLNALTGIILGICYVVTLRMLKIV